jgi:hypothetical protein
MRPPPIRGGNGSWPGSHSAFLSYFNEAAPDDWRKQTVLRLHVFKLGVLQ